jgi:hypothetical protein
MSELDRIFFGQPMAWREGFFTAIESGNHPDDFQECIEFLDEGKERVMFKDGWDYAVYLRKEHNKSLNES